MPPLVKPDWESAPTSAYGAELVYNVHDAADDFEAWAAVRDFSVPVYLGFIRGNFQVTRDGPNLFKARVPYVPLGAGGSQTPVGVPPPLAEEGEDGSPPSPTDALDGSFTFDFSITERHITSVEENAAAGTGTYGGWRRGDAFGGGTAPYVGGVIGLNKTADGTVQITGCDIPEAAFAWTKKVARKHVTSTYKEVLANTVGKLNAAEFYHESVRTQLLAGVSGRQLNGNEYALEFRFLGKPVVVPDGGSYEIAPETAELPKLQIRAFNGPITGWDVIWCFYEMKPLTGVGMLPQPTFAYVEKPIRTADFSLLKI